MTIVRNPSKSLILVQKQLVASDGVTKLSAGVDKTSSQALVIQGYALSALQQPLVDFSGFNNLKDNEDSVNNSLKAAKDHANNYLNTLQPSLIKKITDIQEYFNVQNALGQALQPDMDNKTVIMLLDAVQSQAVGYQSDAKALVLDLQKFRTTLSSDASNFNRVVADLNTAVNGDHGALADLSHQLDELDSKIGGAIAGIAISGLAIAGGAFLVAVGGIADFVTAGASTPLVLAGVGIVATGVGGAVGGSIALANLMDAKGNLLRQKSQLTDEVNLATGMKSGFSSLATHAEGAMQSTQEMANAWGFLSNHLGALIKDIEKGKTSAGALRTLFLTAAQGDVKNIQTDITTISGQLAGARKVVDPSKNIGEIIRSNVRTAQAA